MSLVHSAGRVLKSILQFALGEVAARLCALALFAYITRRFGVVMFGYLALAQTVANYVTLLSDQGYKMVGARLVARNHEWAKMLAGNIVPRRVLLAVLASAGGCLYAMWGPMPSGARGLVAVFSLCAIPAAFALDWVLWGTGSFYWLSGWKTLVAVIASGMAIVGMATTGRPLISISVGTICSSVIGSAALWLVIRRQWKTVSYPKEEIAAVRSELRTSKVLALGTSNILNLVFTNSDLLILAALTNATEVGNYGAATRLLYVIFSAYYLVCNSLYPRLARIDDRHRMRTLLGPLLALLFVAGSVVAFGLIQFSTEILGLVYGSTFGAQPLFRVLMLALPFEMIVSFLGTMLASRGGEAVLLRCLAVSSVVNVGLNLILIPRLHAMAAAWTTVASYALLCILYLFVTLKPAKHAAMVPA